MRILSWNIKWGGQNRVRPIGNAISERDPDVVVLTEYQPRGSAPLLGELAADGWRYHVLTSPAGRLGGVAIVSRLPLVPKPLPTSMEQFATRYVSALVLDAGVEIRGMYGLLKREPHAAFWNALLGTLASDTNGNVLLTGDFNTGKSKIDTPVDDFFCSDYFCTLPQRGFVDLWRKQHGEDAREYTWRGSKNPYRLDHAFGSASVADRLLACEYSHKERELGISDHSLMSTDLSD